MNDSYLVYSNLAQLIEKFSINPTAKNNSSFLLKYFTHQPLEKAMVVGNKNIIALTQEIERIKKEKEESRKQINRTILDQCYESTKELFLSMANEYLSFIQTLTQDRSVSKEILDDMGIDGEVMYKLKLNLTTEQKIYIQYLRYVVFFYLRGLYLDTNINKFYIDLLGDYRPNSVCDRCFAFYINEAPKGVPSLICSTTCHTDKNNEIKSWGIFWEDFGENKMLTEDEFGQYYQYGKKSRAPQGRSNS